jgi:serine/threonine protein kinase
VKDVSVVRGTVQWIAPEIIKAPNLVSTHSDIWSFGCTVLEMVSNGLPWGSQIENKSEMEQLIGIANQ